MPNRKGNESKSKTNTTKSNDSDNNLNGGIKTKDNKSQDNTLPENQVSLQNIEPAQPPSFNVYADSTSHQQVSMESNRNYSHEIINDVDTIYNLPHINQLIASKNGVEYKQESAKQVFEICRRRDCPCAKSKRFYG